MQPAGIRPRRGTFSMPGTGATRRTPGGVRAWRGATRLRRRAPTRQCRARKRPSLGPAEPVRAKPSSPSPARRALGKVGRPQAQRPRNTRFRLVAHLAGRDSNPLGSAVRFQFSTSSLPPHPSFSWRTQNEEVKRCGGCHGRRTIARRALKRDVAPDRPQSRAIEFWYSTPSTSTVCQPTIPRRCCPSSCRASPIRSAACHIPRGS
jgi:hypothetical protein